MGHTLVHMCYLFMWHTQCPQLAEHTGHGMAAPDAKVQIAISDVLTAACSVSRYMLTAACNVQFGNTASTSGTQTQGLQADVALHCLAGI